MKQIANILIDYGFDFEYENRNSNGETIIAHQIDLKVSTYQGTVFFEHNGESEEFEENVETFNRLRSRTEKLLISETSSFED
jgi:hypothetical protein